MSYYQADGLGTITSLSGPGGGLRGTYEYDSFGVARSSTDRSNWYRYTARQLDPETGVYYYRARYYDPAIGRFLSEDPIGYHGGTNLFTYSANKPGDFRDPFGLYTGLDDLIFIAGGVVVGLGSQALSDLLTGNQFQWENYVGAAVAGVVGGELLLYTGPLGAGAAAGAAGDITTQFLKHNTTGCSYSAEEFLAATGLGAIAGLTPGIRIPGVTAGRNSFNAVYLQMVTKLRNGTISRVTGSTGLQMFLGRAMDSGMFLGAVGLAGAAAQGQVPNGSEPCPCR